MASQIGYPVMLKASAGGGGIGMQLCHCKEEVKKAFATTKARAKTYFGNEAIYMEKYIENPRHIEVQIVGDQHGTVIHMFEKRMLYSAASPEGH